MGEIVAQPGRRVFVAGATGVIGRVLCRLLKADGWQVTGTTRRPESIPALTAAGVEPALVDVFNAEALTVAIIRAQPLVVIQQLTDLPDELDQSNRAAALESNARIREIGTMNLVDASIAAGVERLVAQSIAFAYAPAPRPIAEESPLNVNAADPETARTVRAVQVLESLVLTAPLHGVVLRYGKLYGPYTWTMTPGTDGPVHVDAAAHAARLAATRGAGGVYNVAEPDGTVEIAKAVRELGWDPAFRA